VNYLDRFRNPNDCRALLVRLEERLQGREIQIMEVCGTHTHAIAKSGLRAAAPPELRLLSGPGCPVCVTTAGDIDAVVRLARRPGTVVCTFGDLIRVPGSDGSLADARAAGATVELCYSPMDALDLAASAPHLEHVFAGIGFETTAPTVACTVVEARRRDLANFSVFASHKLVPPAMLALLAAGDVRIDAFLCPGHVSMVIGCEAYEPVIERYRVPCVIAGFEPLDVLQSIDLDGLRSGSSALARARRDSRKRPPSARGVRRHGRVAQVRHRAG